MELEWRKKKPRGWTALTSQGTGIDVIPEEDGGWTAIVCPLLMAAHCASADEAKRLAFKMSEAGEQLQQQIAKEW
jgi:hypothetical protein